MPKRAIQGPKVSERSTKKEVLDAYHTILAQVEGEIGEDVMEKEEQQILDTASKETVEKITNDLSSLKLSINQTISSLSERLTQEAERLATIQKAIHLAQKELEETQKIKVTAGMLYRLIEAQKKQEEEFEKEIEKKKLSWDEEQKVYEEQTARERKREEEEYTYTKNLERRRDKGEWEEERIKRVHQKEEEAKAQKILLDELEDLRKKVANFPVELEKEIKTAISKAETEVKKEAQIAQNFAQQEADGQLKIAQLKISSLEDTIKVQQNEIREQKRQLDESTRHVKDIAVAVVEGRKETSSQRPAESAK